MIVGISSSGSVGLALENKRRRMFEMMPLWAERLVTQLGIYLALFVAGAAAVQSVEEPKPSEKGLYATTGR